MATRICNATGNLTGAATFAAAEAGALALVLNRNTTTAIAAATTVTSTTFTVTTGNTIDAILLWLKVTAASPTGTFKVDLQKSGVSQASVTVNKADLPDSTNSGPIPVLFKLGATAAGTSTSVWTIVITTTGAGTVTIAIASATTSNFTRALRTTTAATPAAADDLYVIGELTGAGAHTSRTVTMDSTAATAYGNGTANSITVAGGGIHVSCYGTLAYGTTASTNYILRVNGDLIGYQFGVLSIGSSGSEIPRSSTAVLEFQQISADADFGLRCLENFTFNAAGLSRTSGKNVTQCKLSSDVASSNVITSGPTATNATNTNSGGLDAGGVSLLASTLADTVTNATHSVAYTGPSVNNTTQTAKVWLARGTGTNNRFVRLTVGNNTVFGSVTNGFFVDIDLQAGTVGAATAIGTGTATSASITAVGGGFVVKLTGKVASTAATPSVLINICSAATTTSFAGAGNQSLLYEDLALVTAASIADTVYNVDTDTGWLSGDLVCVAATTRTLAECEDILLSANAGASSFTSAEYPFGIGGGSYTSSSWASTHHGTSPVQAEIGLLTRNVKIRSTSPTLMTYIYFTALASVNVSWAQFYYLGNTSLTNRRGIEIDAGATASAKTITFCSVHDCESNALFCVNVSTSLNLTFSNNVIWNTTLDSIVTSNLVVNTDWTFDSNLVMRNLVANGFSLTDLGGTCTNNTVAGAGGFGFLLSGSIDGTFDGNACHAGVIGLEVNAKIRGTVSNFKCWRNTTTGIVFTLGFNSDIILSNLTLFGNPINIQPSDALTITGTSIIAGDTTFSSGNAISIATFSPFLLDLGGVDFSGSTSIFAPHTGSEIAIGGGGCNIRGSANNCKFGAPFIVAKNTTWESGAYMSFEKFNQAAGDHRTEMLQGQVKTDTSVFNTASPSMRMTPSNIAIGTFAGVSTKLESAPKGRGVLVAVASGGTVNISAFVRKSVVGDGAAYNGAQPRLIQRANPALGQVTDVVLDTASASAGNWEQLTGTSSAANDDGAWEFIVDCDGTAGWVNVDDWAAA